MMKMSSYVCFFFGPEGRAFDFDIGEVSQDVSDDQSQRKTSGGLQPERVSRRQFLTYTLASVGGFLASGMLFPMVRMTVDPLLQKSETGDFIKVGTLDEFGPTPKEILFKKTISDGWYETEQQFTAWVTYENGKILALSPICKHLGCTVNWEGGGNENRYYCPCHNGLYYKNGLNVPNTPPPEPLDRYEVKIEGNDVLLGPLVPNTVTQKPEGEA